MAEGQILQNPVGIGWPDLFGSAETATATGAFALQQMAFTGA